MSSQNTIQDELKSLNSSLLFINSPVFSVPEGYFDGLATAILAKVKKEVSAETELRELSPFLASLPKEMPYSVPFSFFEGNVSGITENVKEVNSSILDSIGKEMPYAVPNGFFEEFAGNLLLKVTKPKAKVVPLFARTWMRVASAAVIGGAMFIGGYQLFNKKPQLTSNTTPQTQQMAKVEPIKNEIKKVSTEELENFIKDIPVTSTASNSNKKENKPSVKKTAENLLKDVSVHEMENFLTAMPATDDELLLGTD